MFQSYFRKYPFKKYNEQLNAYGQRQLIQSESEIKMAIFLNNQALSSDINYSNAQYIGITESPIDDTYIINYNGTDLKVLYINSSRAFTVVYLQKV